GRGARPCSCEGPPDGREDDGEGRPREANGDDHGEVVDGVAGGAGAPQSSVNGAGLGSVSPCALKRPLADDSRPASGPGDSPPRVGPGVAAPRGARDGGLWIRHPHRAPAIRACAGQRWWSGAVSTAQLTQSGRSQVLPAFGPVSGWS